MSFQNAGFDFPSFPPSSEVLNFGGDILKFAGTGSRRWGRGGGPKLPAGSPEGTAPARGVGRAAPGWLAPGADPPQGRSRGPVCLSLQGDALLAIWKVGRERLKGTITVAVKCSLEVHRLLEAQEPKEGLDVRVKIGKPLREKRCHPFGCGLAPEASLPKRNGRTRASAPHHGLSFRVRLTRM